MSILPFPLQESETEAQQDFEGELYDLPSLPAVREQRKRFEERRKARLPESDAISVGRKDAQESKKHGEESFVDRGARENRTHEREAAENIDEASSEEDSCESGK